MVVVSPNYSDHTKFADDWLPCAPGTDGALAMAMGHVILSEFFRDRQVPYFTDYVKTYRDLPFLVTLREHGDAYVPDWFLTAADLDPAGSAHQTVVLDSATGELFLPNGTLATHLGEAGKGKWNLELGDVIPVLSVYDAREEAVAVDLPRGERLLQAHRADLELLRRALDKVQTPYASVVTAVCAQLPKLGRRKIGQVLKAWESGPPREEVGLEPFAPPEYLAGYNAGPSSSELLVLPDTTALPR